MQTVKDEDFNSNAPTDRDLIIYPTAERYLNTYFLYIHQSPKNHWPLHVQFLSILLFQPFVMLKFQKYFKI